MQILLVSATRLEIKPFLDSLGLKFEGKEHILSHQTDSFHLHILITGVGQVATTYHLTKILQEQQFDLLISAGICGSFKQQFELGTVLNVTTETFGDQGAENMDQFIDIFEMNLADANEFPFTNKTLVNHFPMQIPIINQLPKVSSLTLNKVLGSKESIEKMTALFSSDIANMEGAAFFYCALRTGIPFLEIRSISNYIEPRNKENWKIDLAVNNLNHFLSNLVEEIAGL